MEIVEPTTHSGATAYCFPKVRLSTLCLKNTFTVLDTYKGKNKKTKKNIVCMCVGALIIPPPQFAY